MQNEILICSQSISQLPWDGLNMRLSTIQSLYYAHVPGIEGVWATGMTFEDCRKALIETIEEWIAIRLRHELRIPSIDGNTIEVSTEPMVVG